MSEYLKEPQLPISTSLKGIFWIVLITLVTAIPQRTNAQEESTESEEYVFRNERKNIVLFSFGYTHVPEGSALDAEETDGIFVPSIGLDYKRRVSEKWALAAFLDWELDHYLILKKEFTRDRVFIAVLGGQYELGNGLGLFAGGGREFEEEVDLWLLRAGLEYGFDLGDHFIGVASVFYDWKEEYSTYSFSAGISYVF